MISHNDTKLCVSLRHINVWYCKHDLHPPMQHNMRIVSDSIFVSAALSLTNKFSEFYHKEQAKALCHYVNPAKEKILSTTKLYYKVILQYGLYS